MRALTVIPGQPDSARLREVGEPAAADGAVLVRTLAIGICGTDIEILEGKYGLAPPGDDHLIIGHESLGVVVEAPAASGFAVGDRVVGMVRRPDPVPCSSCAVGEWDMCRNGQYTERGIKGLHGFASDRYRIDPSCLIKIDAGLGIQGVLLEPTSVVAKAWEHAEAIGSRSTWTPRRVLVTGAGPIGLLAALLGVQRGLEVHVLDRVVSGPKPALVKELGASYHVGAVKEAGRDWDLVFECTGAGPLLFEVMQAAAPDGVVCLTGVSSGGHMMTVDPGALNRELVLENNVVFGSVNANSRHYQQAANALKKADHTWLSGLITRKVEIAAWGEAFLRQPDDVKTVVVFDDEA